VNKQSHENDSVVQSKGFENVGGATIQSTEKRKSPSQTKESIYRVDITPATTAPERKEERKEESKNKCK